MKIYIAIGLQLLLSILLAELSIWYVIILTAFFISLYLDNKKKVSAFFISLSSGAGVFILILATNFSYRVNNSIIFSEISGIPGGQYLLFIILAIEVLVTTFLSSLIGTSISR